MILEAEMIKTKKSQEVSGVESIVRHTVGDHYGIELTEAAVFDKYETMQVRKWLAKK